MKRILTLVLFIGVALGLSSCTKEVNNIVQPNKTIIFTVQANDWERFDDATFSAFLDVPEIDNYLRDNGGVLVYASFDDGIYEQLPQVYYGISYTYDYETGGILLKTQYSDGSDYPSTGKPGRVKIKVILLESDQ